MPGLWRAPCDKALNVWHLSACQTNKYPLNPREWTLSNHNNIHNSEISTNNTVLFFNILQKILTTASNPLREQEKERDG